MTYEIHGADRESGVDQTMTLDADSEKDALTLAVAKGMLVTKLTAQKPPAPTLDYEKPKKRRTFSGRLVDALHEDNDYRHKLIEEKQSRPAIERIADDVARIRFWVVLFGVLGLIGLIISILFSASSHQP